MARFKLDDIKAVRAVAATRGHLVRLAAPRHRGFQTCNPSLRMAIRRLLIPRFQGVVVPLCEQATAQRPGGRPKPSRGLHSDLRRFIYRGGFEHMVSRRANDGGDIIGNRRS
ncbi:hypothetical protein PpBr36_08739 [Pyricularia pennisetigena]|uniref:hypothetical protein n=1 Tax=Pyricularia pennisetigena TaxID=1578925 RepID=UPI00115262F1|nr:hypothetical protein PpBr36_08739 [Pyricularia pennisetigena]TLS24544.1 hypothetical protein PpBr36_08739 [Pyricularia pennisetigena]